MLGTSKDKPTTFHMRDNVSRVASYMRGGNNKAGGGRGSHSRHRHLVDYMQWFGSGSLAQNKFVNKVRWCGERLALAHL